MGTENSNNNNLADAQLSAERPDFKLSLSPDFGSRFLILKEIGHGAFSTVYAAKELILDRDVALKILDPLDAAGEVQLQRFLNEAKASSLLKHPNIVELYSSGCDLDRPS